MTTQKNKFIWDDDDLEFETDDSGESVDNEVDDILRGIEDKLYETGLLVTATGDPESDVTLRFAEHVIDGEEVQALEISICSESPDIHTRFSSDELSSYVLGKLSDFQADISNDSGESPLLMVTPVVLLNGKVLDG